MNAQALEHHNEDPDHIESHDHHRHEIGIANSAVYFLGEKTLNYGLHVHYTYSIPHSRFGIGVGYERIFDEHKHNILGFNAIYRPLQRLNLNLSPGIIFEGGEDFHPRFSIHFETSYEFMLGNFHIGPAVAFGYDPEDFHLGLGIHAGYGF